MCEFFKFFLEVLQKNLAEHASREEKFLILAQFEKFSSTTFLNRNGYSNFFRWSSLAEGCTKPRLYSNLRNSEKNLTKRQSNVVNLKTKFS